MPLLEDHARRHARLRLGVFLTAAVVTAACTLVFAFAHFRTPVAVSQRLLFAGLMLVATGLLVREAVAQPQRTEATLRLLAQRPADVVWCYLLQTRRGTQLIVATVDGARHSLPVPGARADELLRETAARLPHAVAGYRPEAEATFKRDPRALRRVSA